MFFVTVIVLQRRSKAVISAKNLVVPEIMFIFAPQKQVVSFLVIKTLASFSVFRDVAQLVRVHVWGARGRPFESGHPDN